ncbi:MAG: hypothetical protein HY698_22015 [Deltaproteobacteria bacterium]|nr:hypothetical protein [Deltaproteobacteria bacterium]
MGARGSSRWQQAASYLLPVLFTACFSPRLGDGKIACGAASNPADRCPRGYECGPDNRCHLLGHVTSVIDAAATDATSDAASDAATIEPAPDAEPIDAGNLLDTPDAESPKRFTGSISISDVSVVGQGDNLRGGVIEARLQPKDALGPPTYSAISGPNNCLAWLFTPATWESFVNSEAEGTISVTGTTAEVPPIIPVRIGEQRVAYLSIAYAEASASESTIDVTAGISGAVPGLARVVWRGMTLAAADAGRHLMFIGSALPENNGFFPIVSFDSPTGGVLVQNPAATTQNGLTGQLLVLAGLGSVPGAPAPDFLGNSDLVKVKLSRMTSGGDHFEPFSIEVQAEPSFQLDAASVTQLTNMRPTGNDITLSCSSCPPSDTPEPTGSVVHIVTMSSASHAPRAMLNSPAGQRAFVQCTAPGTSVTISKEVLAALQAAGERVIRTTFSRSRRSYHTEADGDAVSISVGHGITGITE